MEGMLELAAELHASTRGEETEIEANLLHPNRENRAAKEEIDFFNFRSQRRAACGLEEKVDHRDEEIRRQNVKEADHRGTVSCDYWQQEVIDDFKLSGFFIGCRSRSSASTEAHFEWFQFRRQKRFGLFENLRDGYGGTLNEMKFQLNLELACYFCSSRQHISFVTVAVVRSKPPTRHNFDR